MSSEAAVTAQVASDPVQDTAPAAEQALARLLASLHQAGIALWVIDGFGDGVFDPVDIDILVPRAALPDQIATAIHRSSPQIGATLLSWDRDNQFVMVCDPQVPARESPNFLRIHLRGDFRRVGRFFYDGDEVLAAPPARGAEDALAFAKPQSPREFGCYLLEKICKRCLGPIHERALSEVFNQNPSGCAAEIRRFWSPDSAALIEAAARSGEWEQVRGKQVQLCTELRRRAFARRPVWTIAYRLRKAARRMLEYLRPTTGLHVVMLGPDGVGKSTVVEQLQRDLAGAFCGIEYATFAPALLPRKAGTSGVGEPHGKPARSLPASIVKAIWWIIYYSLGYHFTIRPVLARGGLALNHRYCLDAIVDQRRYRYSGPQWLLKLAWRVARKPDLVFLLDAPPEVVQARKREVAFEETVRQRDAYRKLVEPMPYGHVIDATQPVAKVVARVEGIIFQYMADRAARQLALSAPSPATSESPASIYQPATSAVAVAASPAAAVSAAEIHGA